jgi:hypothetical protein
MDLWTKYAKDGKNPTNKHRVAIAFFYLLSYFTSKLCHEAIPIDRSNMSNILPFPSSNYT